MTATSTAALAATGSIDLSTIIGDATAITAGVTNPVSGMLAGVKIAGQALPIIFAVASSLAHNLPAIQAKFADLEAKLEKAWTDARHLDLNSAQADLGAAWADGMGIYDDVGLPRGAVQSVIAVASKDNRTAGFVDEATKIATSLGNLFGLPLSAPTAA